MQVQCRTCGAKVLAEDVNLDRLLAKCRGCQAIFDCSGQVEGGSGKGRRDRGGSVLPPTLSVQEYANSLTITRKWKKGPALFFLFFSLIWDSVTGVFVAFAFFGKGEPGPFPGFLPLFLIPFVLVGLVMPYVAIALLLNRTTIHAEAGRLEVRSSPVPWPGNRSFLGDDLKQLYCVEYVAYTQNDVPQYRYAVWALTRDGDKSKLATGMEEPEQAFYVEDVLEKRLGIRDQPVRGEL